MAVRDSSFALTADPVTLADSQRATALSSISLTPGTDNKPKAFQSEAWRFYETMGEVHYPTGIGGNLCSKLDINIEKRQPDGRWMPDTGNKFAMEALAALEQSGPDALLRGTWINWSVAGEFNLLVWDGGAGMPQVEVASLEEVSWDDITQAYIRKDEHGKVYDLPPGCQVHRVWRQHPRFKMSPDSALKSVLTECRELELLKLSLLARITSRLSSIGILFIPNSMSMPGAVDAKGEDALVRTLKQLFAAPINDPGSTAAAEPILLRGPDDAGAKIRHILLDTTMNDVEEKHRSELRLIIHQGIELPVQTQTSSGETHHWGMWSVNEAALADHCVPVIRGALILVSELVLHAWMRIKGVSEADLRNYRFGVDPTRAALTSNRTDSARQLWDRNALSNEALLLTHGFDKTNLPSADELVRMVGVKMNNPAMATWGLNVNLPPEVLNFGKGAGPGPGGFGADPPLMGPEAGARIGDPGLGLDQS